MAMTGKYGGTEDVVVVSEEIETLITSRLRAGEVYDAVKDVEFYACEDGVVIDTPLEGGGRNVLTFTNNAVSRPKLEWAPSLKVICDAATPTVMGRKDKVKELFAP